MILILGRHESDGIKFGLDLGLKDFMILKNPNRIAGYERGTVLLLIEGYRDSEIFNHERAWKYAKSHFRVIRCLEAD